MPKASRTSLNQDPRFAPIEGDWYNLCDTTGEKATTRTYGKLKCRCQPCKDAHARYRREGAPPKPIHCDWREDRTVPLRTILDPYGEGSMPSTHAYGESGGKRKASARS